MHWHAGSRHWVWNTLCSAGARWQRGFSIFDVLAVTAVFVVLTLFFLCLLVNPNRHTVPKVACTTNLHAIPQGLKLYRDDHNGVYPDALYGFTEAATKQEVTGLYPQYVKEKWEFRCPSAPFNIDDARTVLGRHPTMPRFRTIPARLYPIWDSYDGQLEPPSVDGRYSVKYVTHWSAEHIPSGQSTRQLDEKHPAEDTVVSWCTYHRNYSGDQPQRGSIDLVLFLDGHVKPTPSRLMFPITMSGNVPQGHSYLVDRGD